MYLHIFTATLLSIMVKVTIGQCGVHKAYTTNRATIFRHTVNKGLPYTFRKEITILYYMYNYTTTHTGMKGGMVGGQ